MRSPCRRLTENSTVYTLVEAHRSPIPKDRPGDRAAPGGRPPGVPFAKVRKQMRNGLDGGDSILGFFRVISEFLKM